MKEMSDQIKWFELIFDIIFVVGLRVLIKGFSSEIGNIDYLDVLILIVFILLLFNTWIKVLVYENKIKIIERHIGKKIVNHIPMVFLQMVILLFLINLYASGIESYVGIFIFSVAILRLTNLLIFEYKLWKVIATFFLFLLFVIGKDQIALVLTCVSIFYETVSIYLNLDTISSSILYGYKYKPRLNDVEFDMRKTEVFDKENILGKYYTPHLVERLGILMIVFLAEYMLVLIYIVANPFENMLLMVIGILIGILFYLEFYGMIDHYDEKLMNEFKSVKSKMVKRTIYITSLYFLSILSFQLFFENILQISGQPGIYLFLIFGYVTFQVATILLATIYHDINPLQRKLFYGYKIMSILIFVFLLSLNLLGLTLVFLIVSMNFNIIFLNKNSDIRISLR